MAPLFIVRFTPDLHYIKEPQLLIKGFTLIELLVVVLIIGILAAIALPQYTKAVERSRLSEAVQFLGDAATAQSIYFMQTNKFADGLNAGTGVTEALNSGDITLSAPDTNNWNAPTFTAATTDATHGDGKTMMLQRNKGMYNGGQLSITVYEDGYISKSCNSTDSSTKADFCALAATAGYVAAS